MAGIFLLFLILVLGDVVKRIPMAALVGVMIMVSISTFEWKSLLEIRKMPLSCALVMFITMIVVIATHNLAMGVIAGIAVSAIVFAWKITGVKTKEHAVEYDGMNFKVYKIYGQVFFASTTQFIDMFNYTEDPDHIIIDFKNAHIWDQSAVNCVSKIKGRYHKLGKQVSIVGLNKESHLVVRKVDEAILY